MLETNLGATANTAGRLRTYFGTSLCEPSAQWRSDWSAATVIAPHPNGEGSAHSRKKMGLERLGSRASEMNEITTICSRQRMNGV